MFSDKSDLLCTLTQMITCCTVKPKGHKCGLNPQMWIIVGKYYNHIYDAIFQYLNNIQNLNYSSTTLAWAIQIRNLFAAGISTALNLLKFA